MSGHKTRPVEYLIIALMTTLATGILVWTLWGRWSDLFHAFVSISGS